MNKQNITYIGLFAIALVITIPIAYSAVEPSIIINMIGGQTEKPLQIKDSAGSEVFSVDVDGTVFPVQSTPSELTLVAGTEEVVLDNSAFTGISTRHPDDDAGSASECFGDELTLPLTSAFWKISNVEIKFGDDAQALSGTNNVDAYVISIHEDSVSPQIPLSDFDDPFGVFVATGQIYDNNIPPFTDFGVFKIATFDSLILEAGDDLLVFVCPSSNFTFESRSAISGDLWNHKGDVFDSGFSFHAGERAIGQSAVRDHGFEYYMVVYATPMS